MINVLKSQPALLTVYYSCSSFDQLQQSKQIIVTCDLRITRKASLSPDYHGWADLGNPGAVQQLQLPFNPISPGVHCFALVYVHILIQKLM